MSRLFSFLKKGKSGLERESDSDSFVAFNEPGYEDQSLPIISNEQYEAISDASEVSLWRDGAVRTLYGSRQNLNELLGFDTIGDKNCEWKR